MVIIDEMKLPPKKIMISVLVLIVLIFVTVFGYLYKQKQEEEMAKLARQQKAQQEEGERSTYESEINSYYCNFDSCRL